MNKQLDPHNTDVKNLATISRLLSLGTEQMSPQTLSALGRARETALARQKIQAPAYAFNFGHGLHWIRPHAAYPWIATTLLVLCIIGSTSYWQHLQKHEMMTQLDVAILTDDLPMEVFVD